VTDGTGRLCRLAQTSWYASGIVKRHNRHQRGMTRRPTMAASIGENEATIDRMGTPVSVPTSAPAGERIRRMAAAVGRGVARIAARTRIRHDTARGEEFSRSLAAGLTRGLTLFVDGRGTTPRHPPNGR
jgi:hypothetical protein